jgi:hypothetical protein
MIRQIKRERKGMEVKEWIPTNTPLIFLRLHSECKLRASILPPPPSGQQHIRSSFTYLEICPPPLNPAFLFKDSKSYFLSLSLSLTLSPSSSATVRLNREKREKYPPTTTVSARLLSKAPSPPLYSPRELKFFSLKLEKEKAFNIWEA